MIAVITPFARGQGVMTGEDCVCVKYLPLSIGQPGYGYDLVAGLSIRQKISGFDLPLFPGKDDQVLFP